MTGETILLVEDDAILAMHYHDFLMRRGYTLLKPVPSGEAALQTVQAMHPSLVLMDIELAGEMNGITAAEHLSAEMDIPVIFLTGYSQEMLLQQAKIAAPYGYLVKPVAERELIATIEMTLHRHQLDMQVKHSEARYRTLIEQASDGIFVMDQQGNFLEVNSTGYEQLGYTRAEFLRLNLRDLVSLDALQAFPLYKQQMLNNETIRVESRGISRDGSATDIEISAKMLEDGNIQGIVRDITRRRQAEKSLRMQSAALNAAANAIVITDINGFIQWANPAFSQLSGYDLPEALGRNPRDLVKSGFHTREFYYQMWNTILAGKVWKGEMVNRRKDGSLYNEEMTLTPMLDGDGQVSGFIAIKQDITERKMAEDDLRSLYQASQTFTLLQEEKELAASISFNAVDLFDIVEIAWVELCEEYSRARSVHKIYERQGKRTIEASLTHPLLRWRQQVKNWSEDSTFMLVHLDEEGAADEIKEAVQSTGMRTVGFFPLRHGDQHIGWLQIASHQRDAFDSDERRQILESYANHAATALSNARLYRASQQQLKEMAAIHQIGQHLQKITTPAELAQEIILTLEKIMAFDNCAVLLRDRVTDALTPYAIKMKSEGRMSEEEHLRRMTEAELCVGKGLTGWVAANGKPAILQNVRSDPRYIGIYQHTQSEMCVPLLTGERVFGVVNVESSRLAAYNDHDLRMLQTVAGQIAVSVQNVQLFQSLQEGHERLRELNIRLEEVEEAERKRLANELHDQVGQNLSAINLSLNLIRSQILPEQIPTVGARVDDSLSLLEETVQRIRSVMTELRPSILDDYGLAAALRWLGEQFAWRTGVQFVIEDQVKQRLITPIQETALFRITQEALANISKHAAAEAVLVRISQSAGCLRLSIEDDGIGFSPDVFPMKNNSSGWGVNIMRERAEAVGGKLKIETSSSSGVCVIVEVPLQGELK